MISDAEVRRTAARLAVDPMIVDLDYVLGCLLASLFRHPEADVLRFKGGTCLKKCYYPDYRFSEDLDFTLSRRMSAAEAREMLNSVVAGAEDEWEIDFRVRPLQVEVVDDEYGKESYEVRVYYRGPLRRGGDPRAIRLDLTTDEVLEFPISKRAIVHPYSDVSALVGVRVPCYGLLETVAEKVRALSGQRRYAISRDVYDIDQLTRREEMDVARLVAALPAKWRVKGLETGGINVGRLAGRQAEFQADWDRNLVHLLPADDETDFTAAWGSALDFIKELNRAWRQMGN